jgi:hypothetical protein
MRVHIVDDHYDDIRVFDAEYEREKSKLVYHEGGFLGFGSKEKTIPCNYSMTHKDTKGTRHARYMDIGDGELKQIDYATNTNKDFTQNYIRSFKHAEAMKDLAVPAGMSLFQVVTIAAGIVLLASAVAAYFLVSHGYTLINNLYKPVNSTLNKLSGQISTQQALIKNITVEYNRSSIALNASLREIALLQREILSTNGGST